MEKLTWRLAAVATVREISNRPELVTGAVGVESQVPSDAEGSGATTETTGKAGGLVEQMS